MTLRRRFAPACDRSAGRYLEHVVCTERKIGQLFDRLRAEGIYDGATILVHGDHGSRIGEQPWINLASSRLSERDILDHFATLLAVKTPGSAPGVVHEPVEIQETFATSFLGAGTEETAAPGQVLVRDRRLSTFGSWQIAWPRKPDAAARLTTEGDAQAN